MPHRRPGPALAPLVAAALLLTGCGGSDEPAPSTATGASTSSPTSAASQSADVDYATIEVPDEFGGGELPVPPGLTPGEPQVIDGTWVVEFDGIDKEEGVAFYADALPSFGYTIVVGDELQVSAENDVHTVSAGLGAGVDGVRLIVEPS